MTRMTKSLGSFSLQLLGAISLAFCIHSAVLHYYGMGLFDNHRVLSYLINYLLALAVVALLQALRQKYEHLLGFVFMGGSLGKFAVYFLVFQTLFKRDGQVETTEATAFLIPYILCLFLETFYLVKLLNKKA